MGLRRGCLLVLGAADQTVPRSGPPGEEGTLTGGERDPRRDLSGYRKEQSQKIF